MSTRKQRIPRGRKKADYTTEIGFEQQVWSAANKPCDNMGISEYKNVVLGLVFSKHISDKFGARHR